MAKQPVKKMLQIGDEIEFLVSGGKRGDKIFTANGTVRFIASCRKFVSVYPHTVNCVGDRIVETESMKLTPYQKL